MKGEAGAAAAAAACTILSIEPEGATRDIEDELLLIDVAPLLSVNPLHMEKAMGGFLQSLCVVPIRFLLVDFDVCGSFEITSSETDD